MCVVTVVLCQLSFCEAAASAAAPQDATVSSDEDARMADENDLPDLGPSSSDGVVDDGVVDSDSGDSDDGDGKDGSQADDDDPGADAVGDDDEDDDDDVEDDEKKKQPRKTSKKAAALKCSVPGCTARSNDRKALCDVYSDYSDQ